MSAQITGNLFANQNARRIGSGQMAQPFARGTVDFSSPYGSLFSQGAGQFTVQAGPTGIAAQIPYAFGFGPNQTNTIRSAGGLTSVFANTQSFINRIPPGAFGFINPYTPLAGTLYELNPALLGALPGSGGIPGGGFPSAGNYPGDFFGGGFPGGPGGFPGGGFPGGPGGFGGFPGGGFPGGPGGFGGFPGGGFPGGPGGFPGLPSIGPGGVPTFPDLFTGPLFSTTPGGVPGIAQTFTQQGGGFNNNYDVVTDGLGRVYFEGNGRGIPRDFYSTTNTLRTPAGIYEVGIGPRGGIANAGIFGAEGAGDFYALVRNPVNPAMIVSYANPRYNAYNFNDGFTFA